MPRRANATRGLRGVLRVRVRTACRQQKHLASALRTAAAPITQALSSLASSQAGGAAGGRQRDGASGVGPGPSSHASLIAGAWGVAGTDAAGGRALRVGACDVSVRCSRRMRTHPIQHAGLGGRHGMRTWRAMGMHAMGHGRVGRALQATSMWAVIYTAHLVWLCQIWPYAMQ